MRSGLLALFAMAALACGGNGSPTMPPAPPPTTLPPLVAPEPVSPPDGAVFGHFPRTLTLEWTAVPRAEGFAVEIEACMDELCLDGTTTRYNPVPRVRGNAFTFDFVGEQPGRWRVYAIDDRGNSGPASAWRYFRFTI